MARRGFMDLLVVPWVDKAIAIVASLPFAFELYRRWAVGHVNFPRAVLGLDRGPEKAKDDVQGGFVVEPEAESQRLENGADGQLRLGLRSFLVRSRRGSVVGGGLHLFFCVCWVFQGRITLGWRGLSMATSP